MKSSGSASQQHTYKLCLCSPRNASDTSTTFCWNITTTTSVPVLNTSSMKGRTLLVLAVLLKLSLSATGTASGKQSCIHPRNTQAPQLGCSHKHDQHVSSCLPFLACSAGRCVCAFDFDNTLSLGNGRPAPGGTAAVNACQSAGYSLAIATASSMPAQVEQ